MSMLALQSRSAKLYVLYFHTSTVTLADSYQALRTASINIWDLIAARQAGDLPPPKYHNRQELRQDLKNDRGRIFPLSKLKQSEENKLLRALLITLR